MFWILWVFVGKLGEPWADVNWRYVEAYAEKAVCEAEADAMYERLMSDKFYAGRFHVATKCRPAGVDPNKDT